MAVMAASLSILLLAASASAAFVAPSFLRQWDLGPAEGSHSARSIATDPFGDVYVLIEIGGGVGRVLKYHDDGTPVNGQWLDPVPAQGALATDPLGHVYIATRTELFEFTSSGGLLGEFEPVRFAGGPIAIDGSGHVYANGTDGKGLLRALNEYAFTEGDFQLLHSAPYPGTPNGSFLPFGFFGLAVDPLGNVYASGISSTDRFLIKFGPELSEPTSYLEDCPASVVTCAGGFGLAYTSSDVSTTAGEEPTLYASAGYRSGDSANFYRMGVYGIAAGPPGSSQYLGSFGQVPVPSGSFTSVGQVAASPCHAAVYELVTEFGGPNNTISGNAVQEFDTHALATPCAAQLVAVVSGFARRYVLRAGKRGSGPCVPCAAVLPSGAFAAPHEGTAGKGKDGVRLRFRSSAAADARFILRRIGGEGPKRKLGGFVYAAHAGPNAPRFSGVLGKGRRLTAGIYEVTVTAGGNQEDFKLEVVNREP